MYLRHGSLLLNPTDLEMDAADASASIGKSTLSCRRFSRVSTLLSSTLKLWNWLYPIWLLTQRTSMLSVLSFSLLQNRCKTSTPSSELDGNEILTWISFAYWWHHSPNLLMTRYEHELKKWMFVLVHGVTKTMGIHEPHNLMNQFVIFEIPLNRFCKLYQLWVKSKWQVHQRWIPKLGI